MNKSRRTLSFLLCLVLLSSLWTFSARAEGLGLTGNKAELAAGESITLTLSLTKAIENCSTLSFRLWFNSSRFQLSDHQCGDVCPDFRLSTLKECKDGSAYDISYLNEESRGISLPAGVFYTLTFTVTENLELSEESTFRLELRNCLNDKLEPMALPDDEILHVKLKATERYRLSLRQDSELLLGEGVQLDILVSHPDSKVKSFSALDLTLRYDPELLQLDTKAINGAELSEPTPGTLRLLAYGPERSCSTDTAAFRLCFSAIALGKAQVQCTTCYVDDGLGADVRNAPAAELKAPVVTYSIRKTPDRHSVTLPDIYVGEKTVADGDDYLFRPTDSNYDYLSPTANIDGVPVPVKKQADGSYLVEKVSGELVIEGSRSAKTFSVTLEGSGREDVTAASKAEYHKDFPFTINKAEGFTYTVTATVGSDEVNVEQRNGRYIVPGSYVTDDLRITVEKAAGKEEDSTQYTVTYSGTGLSDVKAADGKSAAVKTIQAGEDLVFAISPRSGYRYTVTVSCAGKGVTPVVSGNTYTVPAELIKGNILVKIARTSSGSSSGGSGSSSSSSTGSTSGSSSGSTTVTVSGEGSNYVNCSKNATLRKDFSFSINSPLGAEYEPVVTIGGQVVPLTNRGSGSYVIPASAVTGPISISVNRAEEKTVSVSEYLKLRDRESIYCLSVPGTSGDGRLYSYDGISFFFDETHARHVLLLRSSEPLEAIEKTLETKLKRGAGNAERISSAGDANESGRVDINDAQCIFNTYLLRSTVEESELQALLTLDVNGDAELDTGDAVAVMTMIKEAEA